MFSADRPFFALRRYPSINPAREGLRLPTFGPPTKEVAHFWHTSYQKIFLFQYKAGRNEAVNYEFQQF